jgi:hypothetical protein
MCRKIENLEISGTPTKNIITNTKDSNNNKKREAINAAVIRSHQVEFTGGVGTSFEETKALILDSEHVPEQTVTRHTFGG